MTSPVRYRVRVFTTILLGLVTALGPAGFGCRSPVDDRRGRGPQSDAAGETGDVLFASWNVENLFDDRFDHRAGPDKEYDAWFASDPAAREEKYAHLSEAIIAMNGGRGPDILAVMEVEGLRAAELLQDALNRRLPEPGLQYSHLLMKEVAGGRHIAPAILTRLPVRGDKTRLHGRRQRILEGHVVVNGHDLVVFASHWTSRITDKDGRHRADYADQLYGAYRAMWKSNPAVDLIICGDFNDPPDAPSVRTHLHAVAAADQVRQADGDLLLDLMAGKEPARFGTHYHEGWWIFDQFVVSPGLLDDRGWRCEPESVTTVNTLFRPGDRLRRPWRFGNEHDRGSRGTSDHFPITVRLRVAPGLEVARPVDDPAAEEPDR